MAKIIYAMQDGADFYIYADESGNELERTITAPLRVGLNLNLALRARQWFEAFIGETGLKIVWINPFAPQPTASRVTNMVDMSGYTGDDLEF